MVTVFLVVHTIKHRRVWIGSTLCGGALLDRKFLWKDRESTFYKKPLGEEGAFICCSELSIEDRPHGIKKSKNA